MNPKIEDIDEKTSFIQALVRLLLVVHNIVKEAIVLRSYEVYDLSHEIEHLTKSVKAMGVDDERVVKKNVERKTYFQLII